MLRAGLLGSFWRMEHTGSGQYTRRLYEQLVLRNDVQAVPFVGSELPLGERPEDSIVLPAPSRAGANLAKLWREQVSFPCAARRAGMDLIHIPYWAPPFFHRLPVVVTVHDIIPMLLPEYRGSALVRAYSRLAAAACRRADVVLTDSAASARDIVAHLRVAEERVRVVYLAASEMFRPVPEPLLEEARVRLDLPWRYLLYLGGFDCRKNVSLLLTAFARLTEIDPDIVLLVAGKLPAKDTAFSPDPRLLAEKLGLERVRFLGWVDEQDKPALYSAAVGLCFPSAYEGFGLPVLEALSCGTPAIVGDNSSLPEIVGLGGLTVPLDEVSLAEGMRQLTQDDALRQRLASAGLEHAARFSWQTTAEQTVEAYRLALGEREP